MKIESVTITQEELNSAVETFLKFNGIFLPIENCKQRYSYGDDYEVTFKKPVPLEVQAKYVAPATTETQTTQI